MESPLLLYIYVYFIMQEQIIVNVISGEGQSSMKACGMKPGFKRYPAN